MSTIQISIYFHYKGNYIFPLKRELYISTMQISIYFRYKENYIFPLCRYLYISSIKGTLYSPYKETIYFLFRRTIYISTLQGTIYFPLSLGLNINCQAEIFTIVLFISRLSSLVTWVNLSPLVLTIFPSLYRISFLSS